MPRINYFAVEDLVDPELRGALHAAARHGTPAPESQAVRAHAPEILRAYTRALERTYRQGICDLEIKELCRGAVVHGTADARDEREQAAVDYALAIHRDPSIADAALWERLRHHFAEEELIELGWFIGLIVGQHRWLRTIEVGHDEVRILNRRGAVA